jgi:hypothetical protein
MYVLDEKRTILGLLFIPFIKYHMSVSCCWSSPFLGQCDCLWTGPSGIP